MDGPCWRAALTNPHICGIPPMIDSKFVLFVPSTPNSILLCLKCMFEDHHRWLALSNWFGFRTISSVGPYPIIYLLLTFPFLKEEQELKMMWRVAYSPEQLEGPLPKLVACDSFKADKSGNPSTAFGISTFFRRWSFPIKPQYLIGQGWNI